MRNSGVLHATAVVASALRTIFHELRTQLRMRPLGFHIFRETGGMSKGGIKQLEYIHES